ncbi:hypothetical protein QQ045_015334 [Rhodiola kirilowii]
MEGAQATFLPPEISDHSPVIVYWGEEKKINKSFRYCNFWENLEDYEEAIWSTWSNVNKCRNLFMIQTKLKNMKIMLKQRFVGRTRGMDKRVNLAREALLKAQSISESNANDIGYCESKRRLALEFRKIKYNQFLFNKQRTNAQWIKEGDANTKFFHSLLKSRRTRNNITQITLGDGSVSTDSEIIKLEFTKYFKELLGQARTCSNVDSEAVAQGPVVNSEQCRSLVRGAADKEIWTALNCIGADKAPGPDGFSSSFFKRNWRTLGKELCEGVRHCLRSECRLHRFVKESSFFNAMPKGVNAAYIALIPRSSQDCKPEDYHPISCCNVTYKIVSSLLAAEGFYYHPKCHRIKLSHMMFADDLILFSSGRTSAIGAIKRVVTKFPECSGLSIKFQKSHLFTGGINDGKVTWVEEVIGTKTSPLPVRYLGISLTSRSLSRKDCDNLIEKITARLEYWSNRFLSRAGRRVLVSSVLQAMVFFWARVCILPKTVIQAVNATCARFFWRGSCDKKRGHLVKWDDMCRDKEDGGLGLKNIETLNFAMVINQMWGKKEASSWVLERLLQCNEIDLWCVSITNNIARWRGHGEGFEVKDTYNTLIEHKALVEWYKLVWNDFNAPRDSLNAWLVVQNKLMTRDRMSHWGFLGAKTCVLCETMDESRDHLYFMCSFTKELLGAPDSMVQRAASNEAEDKYYSSSTTRVMNGVWKSRNMKISREESNSTAMIVQETIWYLKVKLGAIKKEAYSKEDTSWLRDTRIIE